jgi:hypothetical protein
MEAPPGWLIDEWNLFQAARWMGVAPWELAERPAFWLEHGLFMQQVDGEVQSGQVKKGK